MKELLSIEWLKIKSYRTFWVLAILFLVLVPAVNVGVGFGLFKIGGSSGINILDNQYSFPGVWANVTYWGSWFMQFISIMVIIFITNEFGYRTHRQNVLDGWGRTQFFHAKVLLIVVISVLCTVYMILQGLVFGLINSGSFSGVFSELQYIGYFFVLALDYTGFALFIGILLRKSGLAISLFLVYTLVVENLLGWALNNFTDFPIGNMLFLQSGDELLPWPLSTMAKAVMGRGNGVSPLIYLSVSLGWCLVYYFAGKAVLKKQDW